MHKNKAGFTVIESLIVLFISGLTLLLLTMMMGNLKDSKATEQHFWQQFRQQWQTSATQAVNQQIPIKVKFNYHRVIFETENQMANVSLDYPPGLALVSEPTKVVIYENGYNNPQTIKWQSINFKHAWAQKFQLGWGGYRLEKTPSVH